MSCDSPREQDCPAHGFQRSGRLIRDRVMTFANRYHHVVSDATGTQFVWIASEDFSDLAFVPCSQRRIRRSTC